MKINMKKLIKLYVHSASGSGTSGIRAEAGQKLAHLKSVRGRKDALQTTATARDTADRMAA